VTSLLNAWVGLRQLISCSVDLTFKNKKLDTDLPVAWIRQSFSEYEELS